jgi:hypothetical protein
MKLFVCHACGRHVKEQSIACPFCGGVVAPTPCLDASTTLRRMSRAVLLTSASTMLATSSCGAYGAPAYCPVEISLYAPCGLTDISSTCSNATTECQRVDGIASTCQLGPVLESCVVTAVLGDGTTHSVSITLGSSSRCAIPVIVAIGDAGGSADISFTSPTCETPDD